MLMGYKANLKGKFVYFLHNCLFIYLSQQPYQLIAYAGAKKYIQGHSSHSQKLTLCREPHTPNIPCGQNCHKNYCIYITVQQHYKRVLFGLTNAFLLQPLSQKLTVRGTINLLIHFIKQSCSFLSHLGCLDHLLIWLQIWTNVASFSKFFFFFSFFLPAPH